MYHHKPVVSLPSSVKSMSPETSAGLFMFLNSVFLLFVGFNVKVTD